MEDSSYTRITIESDILILEYRPDLLLNLQVAHKVATTITLSNLVPIETVSKLLGHFKIATTQIYARVLEDKLIKNIYELSKELRSGWN